MTANIFLNEFLLALWKVRFFLSIIEIRQIINFHIIQ